MKDPNRAKVVQGTQLTIVKKGKTERKPKSRGAGTMDCTSYSHVTCPFITGARFLFRFQDTWCLPRNASKGPSSSRPRL